MNHPNRRLFLSLLTVLTVPGLALAHGPTRQKVTLSIDLPVPPDQVWALIGNFQDMSWHPAVHSTSGENGNEINASRLLTLGEESGPTIAEVLYKYSAEKRSYSYRITKVNVDVLPVTNYSSHITVRPSNQGSVVEWKGAFYRGYPNNDPPENLNDQAAVAAISGIYQAGLDAIAQHFSQ